MVGSNKKCPHLSDPPHAKYRIENAIVFTAPSSRVAVDKNGDNPPEEAVVFDLGGGEAAGVA